MKQLLIEVQSRIVVVETKIEAAKESIVDLEEEMYALLSLVRIYDKPSKPKSIRAQYMDVIIKLLDSDAIKPFSINAIFDVVKSELTFPADRKILSGILSQASGSGRIRRVGSGQYSAIVRHIEQTYN